jgi:hypothetical protein
MAPANSSAHKPFLHRLGAHPSIRRTRTELSSWLDGHRSGASCMDVNPYALLNRRSRAMHRSGVARRSSTEA